MADGSTTGFFYSSRAMAIPPPSLCFDRASAGQAKPYPSRANAIPQTLSAPASFKVFAHSSIVDPVV